MGYGQHWRDTQSVDDRQGRCLAVNFGAEVADLSEPMRLALKQDTMSTIDRIQRMIEASAADGSPSVDGDARETARALCDKWLGASVMAKIHRDSTLRENALTSTVRILHLG